MRKNNSVIIDNVNYEWYSIQDSEHPDFCLTLNDGYEIWVQVYLSGSEKSHSLRYLNGRTDQPISDETAIEIIKEVISKGYIESYKDSEVGLMFIDGGLIEN